MKATTIPCLRVDITDTWYVLVISGVSADAQYRDFYLGSPDTVLDHMFGCVVDSDAQAVELAVSNALLRMPDMTLAN
jgi:hypothetical protein